MELATPLYDVIQIMDNRIISQYEYQENREDNNVFTSGSAHLQILHFTLSPFGFYLFQASQMLS